MAVRWRTLMFVLIGMAGTVLFIESLGSTVHSEHAEHSEHATHTEHAEPAANAGPGASGRPAAGSSAVPAHHHGDSGTAAFTRPVGIVATFAATSVLCWLVSRRRRSAHAGTTTQANSTGDRGDR